MMISAHGAAAALLAAAYAKTKNRNALATPKNLGKMFFLGILPDVPLSVLVLLGKFNPAVHYHHTWITHTPFFWLVVSLLVMRIFSPKAGASLLAATLLHLAMDWYGAADGIQFLYPFTSKQFGARIHGVNGPDGFKIYISNPLFLALEIGLQGTFLILLMLGIYKRYLKDFFVLAKK